jgi:hypothetical protein
MCSASGQSVVKFVHFLRSTKNNYRNTFVLFFLHLTIDLLPLIVKILTPMTDYDRYPFIPV